MLRFNTNIKLTEDLDIDVPSTPVDGSKVDVRASHCKTAKDLDLFLFSSNYQRCEGGSQSLSLELGLEEVLLPSIGISD